MQDHCGIVHAVKPSTWLTDAQHGDHSCDTTPNDLGIQSSASSRVSKDAPNSDANPSLRAKRSNPEPGRDYGLLRRQRSSQ